MVYIRSITLRFSDKKVYLVIIAVSGHHSIDQAEQQSGPRRRPQFNQSCPPAAQNDQSRTQINIDHHSRTSNTINPARRKPQYSHSAALKLSLTHEHSWMGIKGGLRPIGFDPGGYWDE
jgi:hypothetical protein